MLCRVVNMRGVNLNVFTFDYDLTWAAFLMNADERIYGRFGGRDASSPDRYLTLEGLKYAMKQALATHRHNKEAPPTPAAVRTVEQYPAAQRLKPKACIHCHQVYDFRREALSAKGKWTLDEAWVYPLPDNLGITVDSKQGDKVAAVRDDSPAQRAGIRAGDLVTKVNGQRIASFADIQHALHEAPRQGSIDVVWRRGAKEHQAQVALAKDWRKTDISWRESMWGLEPSPSVYGQDLTPAEKKKLGLSAKALAFRQGNFVPPAAAQAGVRANDVILGIDGKSLEMTMLQFNTWVRLTHQVGDRVTINVIRNGNRLDFPMTLPRRAF